MAETALDLPRRDAGEFVPLDASTIARAALTTPN